MKNVGLSYKQHPVEDTYDAIVIGSGIGGLTAANLLAKHSNKKVLVLERHYTAGGFTHVFKRPGYEWDVGVHYIGEVNNRDSELRAAFDNLTEGRLQWNPMPDVYDRIRIADRSYDFPSGLEPFRERMKQYFPREVRAIDRYIALVRQTVKWSNRYFAEKAVQGPISSLGGSLMRAPFLKRAGRTTASVLAELTGDPELIGVLTAQWGDYGLTPSQSSFAAHSIVAAHYFEGAAYPIGGASEIAEGIAPAIVRTGGQILVGAEVSRILLDDNNRAVGVRMADGRELHAKTIISDAGAYNTFTRLLPVEVAGSLGLVEEIRALPASMSHLCLYVGLKREEGEPEFEGSNLWIFPGADHDGNLARFVQNPEADFPVLFISFPSAKDPAFD
ncbi:MAG TPA: NAD(P)/FAD-dependent oxidoreductase [Blastocatellia bacterium]|nr:NAD(P)/FAD-dependent oxidoreductase [Blastocatellia bacterium]